jgi:hypothetical protein
MAAALHSNFRQIHYSNSEEELIWNLEHGADPTSITHCRGSQVWKNAIAFPTCLASALGYHWSHFISILSATNKCKSVFDDSKRINMV